MPAGLELLQEDTILSNASNSIDSVISAKAESQDLGKSLDSCLQGNDKKALFDCVLSDMAPKTSGIRSVDQVLSLELCERALELATQLLKPNGNFCVKMLESGDTKDFVLACKQIFSQVRIKRPKTTRDCSSETYIIGLGRLDSVPLK